MDTASFRTASRPLLRLAALAIFCAGCATLPPSGTGGGPSTLGSGPVGGMNMLSTEEEVELGNQVAAEIEKENKLLDNPAVQKYISDLGAKLAAQAPRQDVQYTVKVIDAPDTVNAFALPGGHMYVYTGLLKLCESEAELAGVMAHEIAHVAAHHHGESLTRMVGYQTIAGMLLGKNARPAAQTVANVFIKGVSASYDRRQEREADQLGMDILYKAGYSPDAMIMFMYKMRDFERQSGGGYLPIFASHPPTDARLAQLQSQVQQYPASVRFDRPVNSQPYYEQVLKKL